MTYSLVNYHEAEKVVEDFNSISIQAEKIIHRLPAGARNAFYELVLFPTKASAIVNELYLAAGKNALYAKQGRAAANDMAVRTRDLFQTDTSLMGYFNRSFADGKWAHFMDQSHLGYTNWQDPPTNSLRAIRLVEQQVPDSAAMGVSVEGSNVIWPGADTQAVLPAFDVFSQRRHSIEVFNKGKIPFTFSAQANKPWIRISSHKGKIYKQTTLWISLDWGRVSKGKSEGRVKITGARSEVNVNVEALNPRDVSRDSVQGFVEENGCVSIEAEHYTDKTEAGENRWLAIENYGRTLSAMATAGPLDGACATPGKDSPCLEYRMFLFSTGKVDVEAIFGPVLNFASGRGVRYAVSFDDDPPQSVTIVPEKYSAQNGNRDWEKSVVDNARFSHTTHTITSHGYHTLKIWMIDPAVVIEKIVVDLGGVKPSYLGPPESFHGSKSSQAVR